MLKPYPSLQGEPRCPRSPPHSSSWKGRSLLQTNPEHKIWTSLTSLTTSCLHCGVGPPSTRKQRLCLTVPGDPTRTQHTGDTQAILAAVCMGAVVKTPFYGWELEAQTSGLTCFCPQSKTVAEPRRRPASLIPQARLFPGQLGGRWEVGAGWVEWELGPENQQARELWSWSGQVQGKHSWGGAKVFIVLALHSKQS